MRVVPGKAERSVSAALAIALLMSMTVVFGVQGTVKREYYELQDRVSIALGLSQLTYSGRALLARIARVPAAVLRDRYPANIDPLHIDVKFENLQVIREDRLEALRRQILIEHREVNGIVRHGGDVHRARIRLKGDNPGHWTEEERWSLRIELKNGASIWGMSEFSLHKPRVRQYPVDHIFQEVIRAAGNLSPRQTLFRVTFNGDDWGAMSAEEHVSKEMIELQGRKASVIAKFGNLENRWIYQRLNEGSELPFARYGSLREIEPFDEKSIYEDEYLRRLYSYVSAAILDYDDGRIDFDHLFDVDSYSRALIAAIVWNNVHTLGKANTRHYLNPYTLRLEPVTTDQRRGSLLTMEQPGNYSFTKPGMMSSVRTTDPFLDLFQNDSFWQNLDTNVARVLPVFSGADALFSEQARFFPLEQLKNPASFTTPNAMYIENQGVPFFRALAEFVRAGDDWGFGLSEEKKTLDNFKGEYPKHLIARHYSGGILEIENLLLEPVELVTLRLDTGDEMQELQVLESIIAPSTPAESTVVRIVTPVEQLGTAQRLLIESEVGDERRLIQIAGSLEPGIRNPLLQEKKIDYLVTKFPFFSYENGNLTVAQGKWSIDEPVVLPGGVELSIASGTTIAFCTECYLVAKAPVRLEGSHSAPVRLLPESQSWKGLYVLEAGGRSRFEQVEISGAAEVTDSALVLTGGVVFYRSDVEMHGVRILDAAGEDALNIIHSDFSLQDVEICNARSDGFDADFTTGDIRNAKFCNIGGDALDTSGSRVRAENLVAYDIHDKAISIGERSDVTIARGRLERVGTGIVSKDSSRVEASDLSIRQYQLYAAMVYQKKSFYGPSASMSLHRATVDRDATAFLAQTGNMLRVDGETIPTTEIDIDKLYSTGPMKK